MKALPLLPTALLVTSAVLLTGCAADAAPAAAPATPATAAAFHGTEPAVDTRRPSFVLQDTSGRPYDFGGETAGRPTLLYFGFANCADECPTAIANIAAALRTTPPALREQTRVVFVTTDPARDTGPVVRRFLDQWSTDFVGLVGTPAQVAAAQESVGLTAAARSEEQQTLPGKPDEHVHASGTAPHEHVGPLGYGVGHADVVFAFDTDDRLPVLYDGAVRPSDIAADLPLLAPGDTS